MLGAVLGVVLGAVLGVAALTGVAVAVPIAAVVAVMGVMAVVGVVCLVWPTTRHTPDAAIPLAGIVGAIVTGAWAWAWAWARTWACGESVEPMSGERESAGVMKRI